MASSKETYCLCGQPYNIGQFMIECDCCREWFHGSCVDVKIYNSDDIDKYHCPKCVPTYGSSVYKIPTNSHRADRYEIGAESRPSQCGTPVWVRSLAETPLRPTAAALQRLRPQQFTEEFVRDNGFTRPIIFHTSDGLDMKIPNPATFTVRSVLRYVGAQHEVEVIDVRKQASLRMPLSEFVDYFETPPEHRDDKVLNVLSLEFSDTNLCPLVEPPAVLRSLDWANRVWAPAESAAPSPAVQKYCLVSAGGSYTDFHVDFGGTTVWYHVMHGRKIFYLVPPTSTNLALYQQWSASPTQAEQFFGDLVEWYGTAELLAGQTLFIPSGWIHAVFTPRDSLVFGGNLLHSYAIEMQLQVYEIERRVETPLMFRYPLFEGMNWHAGAHLLSLLRRHNEEIQDEEFTIGEAYAADEPAQLPALLLRGVKILSNALKEWHALKSTDPVKRDNVPKRLNSGQLVRELCKELRALEKRTTRVANKDKDYKLKNNGSPTKHGKKQATPKKSLKLTLPKPIMHMAHNGEFEDKYDKLYIEEKDAVYQERYTQPDVKYVQETKYIDSGKFVDAKYVDSGKFVDAKYVDSGKFVDAKYVDSGKFVDAKYVDSGKFVDAKYVDSGKFVDNSKYIVDANGKFLVDANGKFIVDNKYVIDNGKYVDSTKYVVENGKFLVDKDLDKGYVYQTYEELPYQEGYDDRDKKIAGLKIKLSNSPSSSREEPPPYPLPEHSILKSHLVRGRGGHSQQWTISKKEGQYQEVLYTNEHLQPQTSHPAYGPGMYSAEDIRPDYQYSETAEPGSYRPEYFPQELAYTFPRYEELPATIHQGASYSNAPAHEAVNGFHHEPLPTYDAAIAHQYGTTTENYTVEEKKASPQPVRRSVRPVRRRVSATFDYSDSELYEESAPAPRRKRRPAVYRPPAASSSTCNTYRAAAPANGIESLIQASVIADETRVNDTEDAAVAGMLSIGAVSTYAPPFTDPPSRSHPHAPSHSHPQPDHEPAPPESPQPSQPQPQSSGSGGRRARRQPARPDSEDDCEEDVIREVHRDDEYVYPSLEMSSDDDEEWSSSRRRRNSRNRPDKGKGDKDGAWSPRARLGRLVPRLRGPARANVRRECVRAALHHAAHAPHTPHPQNAKRAVLATKSKRPPPPVHNAPSSKNIRLKKGMKTAKQRLGKILKIHKMMH